jgi:hypothetical protein
MAFDRHAIFASALVAIVVAAIVGGLTITGGPGEARLRKEDNARLAALSETVIALACYAQAKGDIPEDLSLVEAEFEDIVSDARLASKCQRAEIQLDPVTDSHFVLRRERGKVTHICAEFATASNAETEVGYYYRNNTSGIADLSEIRVSAGEHCFKLVLTANLSNDEILDAP